MLCRTFFFYLLYFLTWTRGENLNHGMDDYYPLKGSRDNWWIISQSSLHPGYKPKIPSSPGSPPLFWLRAFWSDLWILCDELQSFYVFFGFWNKDLGFGFHSRLLSFVQLSIACVAGVRRGGKGEKTSARSAGGSSSVLPRLFGPLPSPSAARQASYALVATNWHQGLFVWRHLLGTYMITDSTDVNTLIVFAQLFKTNN